MTHDSLVRRHCGAVLGEFVRDVDLTGLPPVGDGSSFRVSVFRDRDVLVYVTDGMRRREPAGRLELFVVAPPSRAFEPWVALALGACADFHKTGAQLSAGHTVDLGMPIVPDATCDHGLVSLPYLKGHGPRLEWHEESGTRFLWLIPITRDERRFKVAHGLEALEATFERAAFNYLDWFRPSVV